MPCLLLRKAIQLIVVGERDVGISFHLHHYYHVTISLPPLLSPSPLRFFVCFHVSVKQLSFFVPLSPTPRGEGSFAALLRDRHDKVFGEDYDYNGGGGPEFESDGRSSTNWRTRALPLAAKVNLVRGWLCSFHLIVR